MSTREEAQPTENDPLLGLRRSRSHTIGDDELVAFLPGDPEDPRNWKSWRKWLMVAAIIPIDLSVSWGASGFSPAAANFSKDMHVSNHVATLGLSMYILGLAFGPMSLAPLSEVSLRYRVSCFVKRLGCVCASERFF